MIRLYRCIRYPNETLIHFQGDPEDVKALKNIPHFAPRLSTPDKFYEKGYYAYLRGERREKSEQEVIKYLSEHFTPPDVELLLFKGDTQLSDDRSVDELAKLLEAEIYNKFECKGYVVSRSGLGSEIYRKNPYIFAPKLEPELRAYEGITFRVKVNHDLIPVIQVDISYRFQYKDGILSENEIITRFCESVPDISTRLKEFTTRDTAAIFKLACNFVKSIPALSFKNLRFELKPLSPIAIDFTTWLWSHDSPVKLQVGKGLVVSLSKSIFEHDLGFYEPPCDPVILVITYPSPNIKHNTFHEWETISRNTETTINAILPSVPVLLLEYRPPDETSTVQACEAVLKEHRGRVPLFLVIAPPENSQKSTNQEIVEINNFTGKLEHRLRKLRRGGYTVTLDWDKLADKYDRPYILENSIIKGLTVMGATPWRVERIAHNPGEEIEDLCFIGMDLNIYKKIPVLGGVIFDGHGTLRGYHLARIPKRDGDKIPPQTFFLLLEGLINHYQNAANRRPQHIIIHRDGLSNEEASVLVEKAPQSGIIYDLIEVTKSGAPRIRQIGNDSGTPSRDIAIGSEQQGTAFLVNTLVLKEHLSKGKSVFPAPKPIGIRRIFGNTPIKVLAAQVYALSLANYNSARRTVSRPITIAYADALVNSASLKEDQTDFGKTIDGRNRAYWL